MIALHPGERILTAYCEHANGPGWSNRPCWVVICTVTGALREECLQPNEQGDLITHAFDMHAMSHRTLLRALAERVKERKP